MKTFSGAFAAFVVKEFQVNECGCFWNGAGCIVKHWSPLLATSKAQQLLFRIVDGLLLPHNITQQDKALRNSLDLYLQVRPSTPSLG